MKNYYFILGLNIYAHAQEVKRAYRKLALQYHPDRNPSAEAAAIFVEVNEAYEVLGDPQRKQEYDQLLQGVPAPAKPVYQTYDPRYRRGPATESASKRKEALALMRDYLKHAIMFSRLALLFSFVLIADYSLPTKPIREEILEVTPKRYNQSSQLALEDGEVVTLKAETAREFQRGSILTIHSSSWFSVPLALENEKTRYKTKVMVSIYGNFKFLPIVMLLTSLLGTFWWKGIEFRFNLGVVSAILILLNFIFLRIHSF
jgi:hypothetical protein